MLIWGNYAHLFPLSFTVKFCSLEAEGGNKDKFYYHLISVRLMIDIKLGLTSVDGRNIFESKVISKAKQTKELGNLNVHLSYTAY